MKKETLAVQAGRGDDASGAVMPPIHLATTFQRGNASDLVYARIDNPNRRALEQCLAALEGGADAMAFASGMAAAASIFQSLRTGDHVVMADDTYFGVRELMQNIMGRWGLECTLVDTTSLEEVGAAFRTNTRLVWLESPSNPLLKISDISAIAALAKSHGIEVAVDSTWATPVLQQPLALGASYVIHSTTKYLSGHSDLTGGVVVTAPDVTLQANIRELQGTGGAVPSAFDAWLLLRGIRTLHLRVRQQCSNAMTLARYLAEHNAISRVFYPGLTSHPGHDIAAKQMSDYGGMLSVQVHGGEESAARVAASTRLFTQATSLGGVESLIEHRAPVEGPTTATPRDLIRISVGIEHIDDLMKDLEQALESC